MTVTAQGQVVLGVSSTAFNNEVQLMLSYSCYHTYAPSCSLMLFVGLSTVQLQHHVYVFKFQQLATVNKLVSSEVARPCQLNHGSIPPIDWTLR